ncbi:MAG: hypothetical protein AB7O62_06505 [Pirellulales bacterium]
MQRFSLCLAMLACLAVSNKTEVASAQDPCCHCHRPVLRAAAFLVRGTVHLVTAPIRLLVHHHHCHGCYGYDCCYGGYGYEVYGDAGVGYGPAIGEEHVAPPHADVVFAAPFAAETLAVYQPIVEADAIGGLTADECRDAAGRAMAEGVGLYRRGDVAVARQYFDEASRLAPDMAAAWGLRGVAAAAAGDEAIAAECAQQVRLITASNDGERSNLYRTLAPVQGQSRVRFEQLVRNDSAVRSIEHLAGNP